MKDTWSLIACSLCNDKFRLYNSNNLNQENRLCKKCFYRVCIICKKHHKKYGQACSKECTMLLREKSNIEKYGVKNVYQSDIIKQKIKDKLIENYGVDHPYKSKEIKEKIKNTCIERYGTDNPAKSEIIKQKTKNEYFKKQVTITIDKHQNLKKNQKLFVLKNMVQNIIQNQLKGEKE